MKNISVFNNCYGCGVCALACPKKIINMELNRDGFYDPIITYESDCIECGICLEVCAYNQDSLASPPNLKMTSAFGGWSKDDKLRETCTTGGIASEIAKLFLSNGEKVCGVKYNVEAERAEHFMISSIDEIRQAQGSKYIPSFTQSGFSQLNKTDKFVVFGLPCQIDSLRRYVQRFRIEDNYTLIDLLCHGTPSLLLWRNYLNEVQKLTGKVINANFRSKKYGWHNSACVEINGDQGNVIQESKGCKFYNLFFTDSCFNKCCHGKCKYKLLNSSADIRLGDFWGKLYKEDNRGVNVIISYTEKGDMIISHLANSCKLECVSQKEAMENQMAENAPLTILRPIIMWGLRNSISLKVLFFISRIWIVIRHPNTLVNKIKNLLKIEK